MYTPLAILGLDKHAIICYNRCRIGKEVAIVRTYDEILGIDRAPIEAAHEAMLERSREAAQDEADRVRRRVLHAIVKAMEAPRKAWRLGKSAVNGDDCYEVYSRTHPPVSDQNPDGAGPYYVRVHDDASMGGHLYAFDRSEPQVWLRCSCPASEHGNPCWHCAKVQLRLVREQKAKETKERRSTHG